eukprot:PLAT448.1.p1 GENE.PLAT448.1~~PLAT448.1.p1  ORF type:complete len:313 (-),score=95.49 PLAT448.1:44-940(-)
MAEEVAASGAAAVEVGAPPPAGSVLLLKAESAAYADAFKSMGYSPTFMPMLRTVNCGQRDLAALLSSEEAAAAWGGLIFTSARALAAVRSAVDGDGPAASWLALPCYVVGEATATAAEALGWVTRGAHCGSGTRLGKYIVKMAEQEKELDGKDGSEGEEEAKEAEREEGAVAAGRKPLLFLGAEKAHAGLPKALEAGGIPFASRAVYRSEAVEELPVPASVPDWLVFFSPAGVRAARAAWGDSLLAAVPPSVAAIGPSTKKALVKNGIAVHITASMPNVSSLLSGILTLDGMRHGAGE